MLINLSVVIPCYNESEIELLYTLNSISQQKIGKNDKRAFIIICDGKVTGQGNNKSTDSILLSILNTKHNKCYKHTYLTREGDINIINLYIGSYNDVDYILMIKDKNYGKRDSLVLIRRLCYCYNNHINNNYYISDSFIKSTNLIFKKIFDNDIEYIINIDADTICDYNCTYELIKGSEYH